MQEMNRELGVIAHLLEVEKEASVLVDDALLAADTRLSRARSQLNTQFKESYDSMVAELEAKFISDKKSLQDSHDRAFEEYKTCVEGRPQNVKEFNSLLDRLLFGAD